MTIVEAHEMGLRVQPVEFDQARGNGFVLARAALGLAA